ncbi:MAG: hypothetical protein KAR00_02465, partial [Candidatus Pacebacteria bacterium]|nr:hypothetical protein [Candidatus Paceibacterota bacterium]
MNNKIITITVVLSFLVFFLVPAFCIFTGVSAEAGMSTLVSKGKDFTVSVFANTVNYFENISKNLTNTFTSNTSNNITPHFKAFIWKPSFQVELPSWQKLSNKLPKLSSLQLPNWELPN